MADDALEKAALAFDASMAQPTARVQEKHLPPTEHLFRNIGELDADTESKGGGDDEPIPSPTFDPEELIYGKSKGKKARGDTGEGDEGPGRKRADEDDGDEADPDDESDDGDGDPDPEDDADDEDGEEKEGEDKEANAILERKVEVTVDGEPVEVSVKEALEGYIRTETFHRRMNQLDEAKKVVRRAAADAVKNYDYARTIAQQMEAHMETMIPKEPNWDEEFKKDPVHARDLQRYYEKANTFKAQMKAQMDEAAGKMEESNQTQLKAFADEEAGKFEAANRKNWSDPKKKVKDLSSMRKTGLSAGFTDEELSQVYDSRMLQVLLKASKYDRMMAAKPKPFIRNTAKPIPPGTGSAKQRTVRKGVTTAMKRLNRSGSVEDAAAVFDQILARG